MCTATLNAQKTPLQQLTVNITDQSGAVIPGALVAVTDWVGVLKTAAYTKADGSALFPIAPGHYEISVRADGFLGGRKEVVFPETVLTTVALIVGNQYACPCVTVEPLLPEPTQPVITALIEPGNRRWFPFHWGRHD